MPSSADEVVWRVLNGAHQAVTVGWCQGYADRVVDGRVEVCLVGALDRAAVELFPGDFARTERAAHLATRAVQAALAEPLAPLIELRHWNDRPGRTQAEVLAVLHRARTLVPGGNR